MSFWNKIVGVSTSRVMKNLQNKVDQINALEEEISQLSGDDLKKKTQYFKEKFSQDINEIEVLDQILPEAFAVMREAMKRVWGERHFDVQLIGGIVLHQGKIAEMKTGEGKTIVAALALYLNSLPGKGVHLVTVNDYLAKHQGEGMGEVYNFLGLSVGIIQSNQTTYKFVKNVDYKHYSECDGSNLEPCSRKEAYDCDIVYGTNNEFGFDYLRDNMAPALNYCSQRGLNFAIVDEVDSILIDEARTPLIISAPAAESTGLYQQFAGLVPKLKSEEDYLIDEKDRVVTLTDEGIGHVEKILGQNIYQEGGINMVHHLEQALKAYTLFKKNKDYIVKEGEIVIVDEFTGRLMVGRRYSEGLHQAIEAKEGVEVKQESQTLATISFQNLFRIYTKLSGMTGTAATEAEEFYKIYKLDVVEIPTNKVVARIDSPDRIYKNEDAKFNAIIEDVKIRNEKGQPVLIGTVSVEKNEKLSRMLKKAGIKHELLNAKNHEREAKIIIKAGQKHGVTVATNMAGRGTDIKLGEGVTELGGLHVIGTERHESRRIDNQLRGRAGRQGDRGSSQFYVSMDDDLMRVFGGERLKRMMDTLGLPDDMPIENKMITKSIESAQKRVEGHNFDIRKHLVEYDDVMNKHREVIYRKRRRILEAESALQEDNIDIKEEIIDILKEEISSILTLNVENSGKAKEEIQALLPGTKIENLDIEYLDKLVEQIYEAKEKKIGAGLMRNVERALYLRTIDMLWIEHLTTMDELRTGIGLRGYGQRDPLVEYKKEAYDLFQSLLKQIEASIARSVLKVEVEIRQPIPQPKEVEVEEPNADKIGSFDEEERVIEKKEEVFQDRDVTTVIKRREKTVYDRMMQTSTNGATATVKTKEKPGRNDPCPCGSGKKYKKCCGRN